MTMTSTLDILARHYDFGLTALSLNEEALKLFGAERMTTVQAPAENNFSPASHK
jgi:hypothetical protein